jgi:uncharacterized YigZ family protein
MEISDVYKTITKPSDETFFKEKGSKFYGYTFPVFTEDDVKDCLEFLQKKHSSARHFCYAWQLGTEEVSYRANDDGEPNNSAGLPIYGQIQSFEVTNILVVSVRYFGGTKLGVGGLISAYKNSAKLALEASKIIEKTINIGFLLTFEYEMMSKVMRILKDKNIEILHQELALNCKMKISVRKSEADEVFDFFEEFYKVAIGKLD